MEPSAQEHAFAAEVERCRVAARVNQQWVAQRVGLSPPKVSDICRGRFLPSQQELDSLVTTLAMDKERAVELWRAARLAREARLAGHLAGWRSLPGLPAEVRSLLRAQVLAAAELPYRLPGARKPSLATVYVRQELGSDTEDPQPEQPRTEPMQDGKVPMSLPEAPAVRLAVRPPSRTIRAALDGDDHLLVTGGPGQGKSTMSLRLAADIAEAWSVAPDDESAPLSEPVVPLRLTARELASRLELPFAEALVKSVRAEYGSLLRTDLDADVLGERVAGCRWLLLVDGLDEVAGSAERDRIVVVLAGCATDPAGSPYRIMLTTRPVEGAALAPLQRAAAARYELQPFDEAALRRFAENWFAEEGSDTADRFIQQVRQAHLDELVSVPLLATIAAIIFGQPEDLPLPDNQYELYEQYLAFLRSARPAGPNPFEPYRTPLLEHLGRVRLEADTSLATAAHNWLAEHAPTARQAAGWQDDLVTFLTLTGPLMLRAGELRFLHHSFAEHLAATATARELPETFEPAHDLFVHLLYVARQKIRGRYARAVLLHYTHLRPAQADTLIDWLHSRTASDQLLAARLLAKHVPTSPAIVDAFLRTARSWAMTMHESGDEILRNITRAAHHPGLGPWLVDLSRDETVPWRARVTAATALASRLHGPGRDEAADLLRAVTQDESVPVLCRLDAAEGLAQCGMRHRAAAEQALRLVVSDPSAPAVRRRGATVVLASLGPAARAHAVEVLLTELHDPWTPTTELVQAAAGLAEIGAEFHGLCAEVFRGVLREFSRTSFDARDAVLGMVALGPQYLLEAVDTLTAFASDRKNDYFDRSNAVEALCELGPQYRSVAGELLLNMLAEPAEYYFYRTQYAYVLSGLGAGFQRQAAAHLRDLLADPEVLGGSDIQAARGMVELGPAYHAEAAEAFWRIANDPLNEVWIQARALGRLARLGEIHRDRATQRLLEQLTDADADVTTVAWAASELAVLGTKYHAEVAESLIRALGRQPVHENASFASSTLTSLGIQFHDVAVNTLISVFSVLGMEINTLRLGARQLAGLGAENRRHAVDLIAAVVDDPARPGGERIRAAEGLTLLGREHHRHAVERTLHLLRDHGDSDLHFGFLMSGFSTMGIGPRAELAEATCALTQDPNAGPTRITHLAQAIAKLSGEHIAHAVDLLGSVIQGESASALTKIDAAVEFATRAPERWPEAVAVIRHLTPSIRERWTLRAACSKLAVLGDDPVPIVRAVLADQGVERELREEAAGLLTEFAPECAGEAVAELRQQAADEHLDYWRRTELLLHFFQRDPSTGENAIAFHSTLYNDEEQPIPVRCDAARQLVRLDRKHWQAAVTTVRRLLADPYGTAADRHAATVALDRLRASNGNELRREAFALVRDRGLSPDLRQEMVDLLRPPERVHAQRILLTDHEASIYQRIPRSHSISEGCPLPAEAEAAIREVLTGPECTPDERVHAAAALAELSLRHVPEAVDILTATHNRARFKAMAELLGVDGPFGSAVKRTAEALVLDDSAPMRERSLAAEFLLGLEFEPKPFVADFLRTIASDDSSPGFRRVGAMFALRLLEPLRKLRDDSNVRAAIRLDAAAKLTGYRAEDRVRSAHVLGQLATDTANPPALRRRAADVLAGLGRPGRARAIDALTAMMSDDALPATARAVAARQLAEVCPSRQTQAVEVLRGLAPDRPLHRRQVLVALGALRPGEAIQPLRLMAQDRSFGPVVRLRCAEALANPRLEQRETASLVARELTHDGTVPWHVRRHAARDLARWSELCRAEAREMINRLGPA